MKKQNATNKLAFNKASVTELNDNSLMTVNGGSSATVGIAISIIIVSIKVMEYIEQQQN